MSLIPKLRALNSDRVLSFIESLRECGNLKTACDRAQIEREVVLILYDRHPIFRRKFDIALQEAGDHLESVAWDRSVNGYYEEAMTKDGGVVSLHKHDNRLLQFMVKGAKKEKYSDKIMHVGHDGGAIQIEHQTAINFDNLSDSDLKDLEILLYKAKNGDAIETDFEEVEDEQQPLLTQRA